MVLVTDDDKVDRELILRYLKQIGHEGKEAATGQECLQHLARENFTCLILDYNLPDCTGLELLFSIRKLGKKLPIILITGHGDEFLSKRLLNAGVDDYIPKDKLTPEILKVFITLALERNKEKEQLDAVINKLQNFLQEIQNDLKERLR